LSEVTEFDSDEHFSINFLLAKVSSCSNSKHDRT